MTRPGFAAQGQCGTVAAVPNFVGPGPLRYREILSPYADDPDWFDGAVEPPGDALTAAVPPTRPGGGPIGRLMFTFVFYGADKRRRVGGTADLRPFFTVPGATYGEPSVVDDRAVVHPIDDEATGYDLRTPYVCTSSPGSRIGLRVSGLTPPGGTVRLRIAIHEIT